MPPAFTQDARHERHGNESSGDGNSGRQGGGGGNDDGRADDSGDGADATDRGEYSGPQTGVGRSGRSEENLSGRHRTDGDTEPDGKFHVTNRVSNPTYYHQGKKVDPGPQNPVGTRWIGLDEKGYGIHGTNAPSSIGKSASHGCIRMAKKDLEEFFEMVRPGDVVEIRSERDDETAEMFGTVAPAMLAQSKPIVMASNEAAAHGGQE